MELQAPKFDLGNIVITPAALEKIQQSEQGEGPSAAQFLMRHAYGDWGEVGDEDRGARAPALEEEGRLMSVYHLGGRTAQKIWIITEWDRSVTTILLPEEY